MPAKKKKKAAASNPARGFATTSIASKAKTGSAVASSNVSEAGTTQPTTPAEPISSQPHVQADADLSKLSPEELEAQLDKNELQQWVEKLGPKASRDSTRTLSRLKTERRVLSAQANPLRISEWLQNEVRDRLATQVQSLVTDGVATEASKKSVVKTFTREDLTGKLWTLQSILSGLYFPNAKITEVLKWVLEHGPRSENESLPWGLPECLDWLTVQCSEDELVDFERLEKQQATIQFWNPPVVKAAGTLTSQGISNDHGDKSLLAVEAPQETEDAGDDQISDLDSDVEPSDMVPQYLKIKTRLFEINPEALQPISRKSKKAQAPGPNPSLDPAARKLQQQLQKIEEDLLFDKEAADAEWLSRRLELTQEMALRKKLGIGSAGKAKVDRRDVQSDEANDPPLAAKDDTAAESENEDGELLGGMFSVESEVPSGSLTADGDGSNEDIKLRRFEEPKGMTARRVIEDTLKTRDSDIKFVWKMTSPTTYSCRYSVSIKFSKDQDPELTDFNLSGVGHDWHSPRQLYVEMLKVAAPSEKQAESFVATAALFYVCTVLAADDKAFLRLSPAWRDLYREFLDAKKEYDDSRSRQTVKDLRQLVEAQTEEEADDEVVLTHNFLRRAKAANSSSREGSADRTKEIQIDHDMIRNMWMQKSSSHAYQHMLALRSRLPIFGFRNAILTAIDQNPITILCGETGCGKSTQLPAYIVEHELSQGKHCRVYCTEPRRISAISLAQRVSEEMGEHRNAVGTSASLVGYAIRLESNVTATTKLIYATVGIVLRMLESANGVDDMTHLIIDEVHERSIDTDFLLVILRSLMVRRPDLKVILMSATVDSQKFSSYLGNAPVLNVPGRTFPVQTRFLEDAIELTHHSKPQNGQAQEAADDEEDQPTDSGSGIPTSLVGYSAATRNALTGYDEYQIDYQLIIHLILKICTDRSYANYSKAFLVFLPGIAEIRTLNEMILNHSGFGQDWWILPLHSTIASEDQQQAFVVPPHGIRKLVLSTNIAETGVTIPDITCVIDTGKHKEMRFDERRQLSRLVQSFISRANAKQRRGRAGRVQEGLCFHLFTKYRHDELMAPQQTPEMLRLSLQDLVMRTKICKLGDIEETLSLALDPPSSKNIRRAIDALIEVDALTSTEELTPLGSQLAKLPLDAHLGKLALLSAIFSCVDAALTLAAILSSKSPFTQPFGAKQRADTVRLGFLKGDSDLLTAYNAYSTWKIVCQKPGAHESDFCRKNFLSPQNLHAIEDLKGQLFAALLDTGLVTLSPQDKQLLSRARNGPNHRSRTFIPVPAEHNKYSENELLVSTLIAASFHPHVLTRDGKGWRNIANNAPITLHPSSVLRLGSSSASGPTTSNTSMSKIFKDPHVLLSYHSILQSSSSRHPAAHSLTPIPILPFLMLAAEVEFKVHAKVLVVDGNRLRYSVADAKSVVLLKYLRRGLRSLVDRKLKEPKGAIGGKEGRWREVFWGMFEGHKSRG